MADFVSAPLDTARLTDPALKRVDVELHRVDQAVPSYEARLYLGNPDASRDTPTTPDHGYLASFFVFGKGACWGEDEGHCHPASGRKFDLRHPPGRHAKVRVTVPLEQLREVAGRAAGPMPLALVAVTTRDRQPEASPLRFARLAFVAYG